MPTIFIFILCSIVYISNQAQSSRTNFQVKSFRLCNDTQGLFKFKGNISKENDNYYIDGYVIITRPLDDNMGVTCKIESKVTKTQYMELFTIREKNFCKACNMYLGEFWYDIQRGAQIIPGTCPLPPRRYEVHHLLVDFRKITLQTFPFGTLRFTLKLVDHQSPESKIFCVVSVLENIPTK